MSEHPYLYRLGRVAGTRELVVHPNYIVVYRVMTDQVEIVGVLHAAREYPKAMRIGYADLSARDQDTAGQLCALKAAGCEPVFQEKASGGRG